MIGKTVSHYKILEKIGEGGMGVVYKAEDTKLRRHIALKFLPPELVRDKEAKERFIQEAQAAASLSHPNICVVHEIDEADERTFIAMEYLIGQSLKEKISSGSMKIEEALDTAIQIAEGLQEAHEKGIVHRDIKPANIMLTKRGRVKIMDFGLAKLTWGVELTKTATIMGTVAYMSPEQAQGEKVDHQTDIWALGAVLYEMLSGVRPFKSTHDQATIYEILHEEPQPISTLRKEVPKGFEQIIKKALKKNLAERYQEANDLLSDLQSLRKTLRADISEVKPSESKPSIAVMPFVDMSPQKDQEYFCDGIAEELINALTHVQDLHVVARTSAFSFKGEKLDVREIGKRLNVKAILEGSIRKAGNRVRITAQLINVEDGYHLWSEKFDRDMDDIFAIQDEISLSIVEKLKVKLLGAEKAEILKRYTENKEAYNLFLMGEHFLHMRTVEGFQKAVACYEEALELDPDFVPAYRGLASVNILHGFWGNKSPHSTYPQAREYLKKGLEIDEGYVDAHWALAEVSAFYEWKWEEAEKRFKHTLQLNPKSVYAHLYLSIMLTILGRHDESVAAAMRSCELDPLSAAVTGYAGHALYKAGRYDEALEHTEKTLSMHPNSFIHHFVLGYIYQKKSKYEKAIDHFEKSVAYSGNAPMIMSLLAKTYHESGNKPQAEILLEALKKRSSVEYVPPMSFFHIYFAFGNQNKAEEWLKKAYDEHDGFLPFYVNTMDENYRIPHTPPFLETIKKTGLVK